MTWRLGLLHLAHALDGDLQAASRRAGGPRELWDADGARLPAVLGRDDSALTAWRTARRAFDPEAAAGALARCDAWWTPQLPARLEELVDPPFALVGRGRRFGDVPAPVVAVVGTRRPTSRGLAFARTLGRQLAERGAVVVSGLALGVDAAAHEGALDASGRTVAVLGSSVDQVAPKMNARLADRIVATDGTLVSEYWLGTSPAPWRFPARNRIVAGLADAVVVVEAAQRSGALITADFALDLGRPVLAVPGPAGATMSHGCHQLLRAGAGLCEGVDDVVDELPDRDWRCADHVGEQPVPTGLCATLLDHVRREPRLVDELVVAASASTEDVVAALGRLELDGWVGRDGAGRYMAAVR